MKVDLSWDELTTLIKTLDKRLEALTSIFQTTGEENLTGLLKDLYYLQNKLIVYKESIPLNERPDSLE